MKKRTKKLLIVGVRRWIGSAQISKSFLFLFFKKEDLPYAPLSKDAVKVAKATVMEFFADENPGDVGLEQLIFDGAQERWDVTIGFTRP